MRPAWGRMTLVGTSWWHWQTLLGTATPFGDMRWVSLYQQRSSCQRDMLYECSDFGKNSQVDTALLCLTQLGSTPSGCTAWVQMILLGMHCLLDTAQCRRSSARRHLHTCRQRMVWATLFQWGRMFRAGIQFSLLGRRS